MPTPLRSETAPTRRVLKPLVSQAGQTEDIRFKDFGSLNTGKPNGMGPITSIIVNVTAAALIWVLWKAQKPPVKPLDKVVLVDPLAPPPPPPPPPPLPPPPKIKTPPPVTPKVVLPEVKIPDPPKVVVKELPPKPTPPVVNAAPKKMEAPPAPKIVPVKLPTAASIPNADKVPTPVRVGVIDSPVAPAKIPVASAVHMPTSGAPGMPGSNTGRGNPSTVPNLGSGQPGGSNMHGTGVQNVAGIPHGIPGGSGNGRGNGIGGNTPQVIAMGQPPQPAAINRPAVQPLSKAKPPQVLSQPKPQYTADATANHVEGTIRVRIHVSPAGQVTVLGVVGGGLGHGLDQNALSAAQAIRFRPALDAEGNPTDWEGVVKIDFQIAT